MQLSKRDIETIKSHKSQFISFKYLGDDDSLQQIDIAASNLESLDTFIDQNECILSLLAGKNFFDPFRAMPTTSFFCENISSKLSTRQSAIELIPKSLKSNLELMAELNFSISNEESNEGDLYIDKHANLRNDIILSLENMGIKTNAHFYSSKHRSSAVRVMGDNAIDLVDNIIICQFIIANIADSYGLTAIFKHKYQDCLKIFLKSTDIEYIDKITTSAKKAFSNKATYDYTNLYSSKICKISFKHLNLLDLYLKLTKLICHKAFFLKTLLTKIN